MSQVPIYNSYPSAAPVIVLDFDGYTVSGTGWNCRLRNIRYEWKNVGERKAFNGYDIIPAGRMINGMYLIHFSGGGAQWAEKLVKQ